MAISFRFEVKKTPSSRGTYPVFIRITHNRRLRRVKTSVELQRLSDWNPDTKNCRYVRTSEKNAVQMNNILQKELEEVREIYSSDKSQPIDSVISKFKGENDGVDCSFLKYAKDYAKELESRGASNYKHYYTFCHKLDGFASKTKKADILFSDLTLSLLEEFSSYLFQCENSQYKERKQRLNPNTIKATLVKFRVIVNKAINEGLMPLEQYPFRNFKMPKEAAVNRQALDEAEISRIIALDLKPYSRIWDARNCFLFSFYCAGIRVGDLLQLRWCNITDEGNRLQYIMEKNQKQRNYPLIIQAKQILSYYKKDDAKSTDYIFPFLNSSASYAAHQDLMTMPVELKKLLYSQVSSKNTLLNKELCKIAELAEIDKHISFHISRHTFASIAKTKDVSSKIVQEALAHSSLSITERYMHNFSDSELDSALKKVFDASSEKEPTIIEALRNMDKAEIDRLLKLAGHNI